MKKLTRAEAEDFLYCEARLLDERQFEEWLKLFTGDGLYWIPMDDNGDPEKDPSVLYDDALTRRQRVYQLLHQPHYSQMPPSRTIRFISNVEVSDGEKEDTCVVRCNVAIFELRPGDPRQYGLGERHSLAARCEYRLRYEEGWRIALRKLVLIDRDMPVPHLPFIL